MLKSIISICVTHDVFMKHQSCFGPSSVPTTVLTEIDTTAVFVMNFISVGVFPMY